MKPIITIYKLEFYGTTRIIAAIGEWKNNSPYWPKQYLFETKKSEYYQDLQVSAFSSSTSVYELEYDSNHVKQSEAEYMFYTLKRLNNRLNKIAENEGCCNSYTLFVTRLARILSNADIYIDYKSFGIKHSSTYDNKWVKIDKRYSIEEINRCVDSIKE